VLPTARHQRQTGTLVRQWSSPRSIGTAQVRTSARLLCHPYTSRCESLWNSNAAPAICCLGLKWRSGTRRIHPCSGALLLHDTWADTSTGRLRRADPAVPFLLIALMGAAISGITMVASKSPHWPAPVTDCSLPAYKSERRPPCSDNLILRPATPPFKGASAPPSAFELEHS